MKETTLLSGFKTTLSPNQKNFVGSSHVLSLPEKGNISFGKTLIESLHEVNKLQLEADKSMQDYATGKTQSIHDVMISISKADIAFRLTMQIRNKIVEAYQEIARMGV